MSGKMDVKDFMSAISKGFSKKKKKKQTPSSAKKLGEKLKKRAAKGMMAEKMGKLIKGK